MTPTESQLRKHDHAIFRFHDDWQLIFHDPRRFGALVWTESIVDEHPLLKPLGIEPLGPHFTPEFLNQVAHTSRRAIKTLIMDQHIVVGIGNIYANEALFAARIRPNRRAGSISRARYAVLATSIRNVLADAITQGGTTLRDFTNEKGQPGYFQLTLNIYGKENLPCPRCCTPIKRITLMQRATFYCPRCQK